MSDKLLQILIFSYLKIQTSKCHDPFASLLNNNFETNDETILKSIPIEGSQKMSGPSENQESIHRRIFYDHFNVAKDLDGKFDHEMTNTFYDKLWTQDQDLILRSKSIPSKIDSSKAQPLFLQISSEDQFRNSQKENKLTYVLFTNSSTSSIVTNKNNLIHQKISFTYQKNYAIRTKTDPNYIDPVKYWRDHYAPTFDKGVTSFPIFKKLQPEVVRLMELENIPLAHRIDQEFRLQEELAAYGNSRTLGNPPLLHVNCDFRNFGSNRRLVPICRKYFDPNLDLQLVKFYSNYEVDKDDYRVVPLQTFNGREDQWPITDSSLDIFWSYPHMEQAALKDLILRYQNLLIKKYGRHSITEVTDSGLLEKAMKQRADVKMANILVFYNYSTENYLRMEDHFKNNSKLVMFEI